MKALSTLSQALISSLDAHSTFVRQNLKYFPVPLNEEWRLTTFPPTQYILQRWFVVKVQFEHSNAFLIFSVFLAFFNIIYFSIFPASLSLALSIFLTLLVNSSITLGFSEISDCMTL
jgi:hypothetical protein